MSRSGYTDDNDDQWATIKYRGQVASAIRGKRGQQFLLELRDALDAMQEKRLISHALVEDAPSFVPPEIAAGVSPSVCALGSLGLKRGIEMRDLDPEDYDRLADVFGVAHQLICEVEYLNDEGLWGRGDPAARWQFMREWVEGQIKKSD